jgi:hypothetical protein
MDPIPFNLNHIDVGDDPEHQAIIERFTSGLPDFEGEFTGHYAAESITVEEMLIVESNESPN